MDLSLKYFRKHRGKARTHDLNLSLSWIKTKLANIPRTTTIFLFIVLVLLLLLRALLPEIVKYVINRNLAEAENVTGYVEGVGLSLLRGMYRLEGLSKKIKTLATTLDDLLKELRKA